MLIKSIDFVLLKKKLFILIILKQKLFSFKAKVIYITEGANWAIDWEGKYITENLNKLRLINSEYISKIVSPFLAKNKIIHFGSIDCLIQDNKIIDLNKSHKVVLTWFHIDPTDKNLKIIPSLNKRIDLLHTSSEITKSRLIELGFDEKKIVIIPLGIDLSKFRIYDEFKKLQLKKKFHLPKNKIIIGSFQKDGVGWGEGLIPKMIKGPDIFCEVVKKLHEDFEIHVFLTGPARGYVKKKMEEYHIPYTHIFLNNYLDIVECYNILDLYIVSSRVEGGPKALLEAMATGVPIVTTNIGMASNLIKQGINGFITDVGDIIQLYKYSKEILNNPELRKRFIANGLKIIRNYSWEKITKQYYDKIYSKLI